MGVAVGSDRRWRLPARRKRTLTIAVPTTLAVFVLGFWLLGQRLDGIGPALTLAGLVWAAGVAIVRLSDTPGPPDPRRLHPERDERRQMLRVVRRRVPLEPAGASALRPLVTQTGLSSARSALLGPALLLTFCGYGFNQPGRWWFAFLVLIFVFTGVATLMAFRDRRACAEFLDRY